MRIALATVIFLVAGAAAGQTSTPVGAWKTVNERREPEGLVRIVEVAGELRGAVEQVYSPPAPEADPRGIACSGERKDQRPIGMRSLSGLRWDGEQYSGGEILDPNNGTSYRCLLRVI